MLLEELLLKHSDKELDEWCSARKADTARMYDSMLSRRPGDPVEWGFMDEEWHPLHDLWNEHRFVQGDAMERPGDLVVGPSGSDWELISMTPHSVGSDETRVIDRKACPTLKHTNDGWGAVLRGMSRVGRPDGSEGSMQRPRGEWIMDLVGRDDGWRILEAAHALSHSNGRPLADNVARIHLCSELGLPILADGSDGPERLGISVSVSTDARRPTGMVPVSGLGSGTELVVFAGVHIEPHPKSYEDSDEWLEVNRWSCEPSVSCIAGFEYPSFVAKSPIVSRYPGSSRNPLYMVPVPCMLPSRSLGVAVAALVRSLVVRGGMPERLVFLDEWIGSPEFRTLLATTPPLPCRDCLRLNTQAENHPMRPKSRRPDSMRNAPEEVRREWEEYEGMMERIFRIADRAACYAEGRVVGHGFAKRSRRARRAAYNKRVELERRIASMDRRASRLMEKGNIDKAAEHASRADELRRRLEELKNGVH